MTTSEVGTGAADPRRSATLVAAGIFLSRIAGLGREIVVSGYLGVGLAADAFKAALRIPNLLQNLLGEGVLSASFIPVYAKLVADRDEEEAGAVAGAVAGLLAALAGVLVVLGVVFARPITVALTPGFTGPALDLTVTLLRIMTPGVGLLVLSAWCLGILNSHRRFFLSYVAPVLWSAAQVAVVVAVGLTGAGTRSLAVALAWGVLAGGLLQLLVQVPTVRRVGGRTPVSLRTDLAGVRTTLRRFPPVLLGRGVVQLAGYADLVLASLLAVGAVSALTYGQTLYLLPISLFGMSVAAAELPELSRMGVAGRDQISRRIDEGLARIAFFVAPTAVLYVVVGDLIVAALFERGQFNPADTRLVWLVVAGYSLGLLAATGSRLLQNGLYAVGDARSPARIAAVRVAVAAVLGVVLMFQLDRVVVDGADLIGWDRLPAPLEPLSEDVRRLAGGAPRLGAVGLAAASGLAAWLELVLLRRTLRRRIGPVRLGGGHLGPTLAAAAGAGVVALVARPLVDPLPDLLAAPAALVPAGLAYLALARAWSVPEAAELLAQLRRRARG